MPDLTARIGPLARTFAEHNFAAGGVSIWFTDRDSVDGDIHQLRFARADKIDPGHVPGAPSMILHREAAQQLLDLLWDKGYRPSDRFAVGSDGAQQEHIKDLRKITDRLLDAALPPTAVRTEAK